MARDIRHARTEKDRALRINEKLLARLVDSGLVDVFEYDDDTQTIAVVGWRDFRPIDPTSAERKRRYRRRLYGPAYYGTEGEVQEVQLPSADTEEIAAIEAEGRALMGEVERRGVAAVRDEADPTPSQRTLESRPSPPTTDPAAGNRRVVPLLLPTVEVRRRPENVVQYDHIVVLHREI